MSMYRQLWIAILLSTLLAMLGSLLASTLSARIYLSEQLAMKNADNASVLALSLSQQNPDAVTVELAVAALFDSGHYELIQAVDPHGNMIVERKAPYGMQDAPRWFVELFPIVAAPGKAQITSGWKQLGSVTLVSHSRFAYRALWRSVLQMVSAMAFAGALGGYLGTLILRRLRRPLRAVIDQAQSIAERRFVTIAEPSVPELRSLAVAMNATVSRIKSMFEEEAARLETLRREANCDPLTGLANRNFFMAQLRSSLENEEGIGGTLLLVRIADLTGINRRLGRAATDELLRRVATVLAVSVERHSGALAARLNGADFSLLLPGVINARKEAEEFLQLLIAEAATYVDNGPSAFVGLGSFHRGIEIGALLAQVDGALAAAEAEGINAVRETTAVVDDERPESAVEWERDIRNALDRRHIRLISFPVVDFAGQILHRECPLRLKLDADGEWLPAGIFLPIAERLKLTAPLDLAAIRLGLEALKSDPALPGLAINVSASSLLTEGFRDQFKTMLRLHNSSSSRLWLEVAEGGVFRHLDAFRDFCLILKNHDCRIGVEHFGRQFSQVGLLHDLGLDYLKIDTSFVRNLDRNPGNQAFLKGLSSIAHNIGLLVIAEGVASTTELNALASIGFDGATGPAVKEQG